MEKGLDICRRYYETYGKPMIHEQFPEYEDRIAAGLVGEGSDCFGFDDELSRDHDWGPGFCLWVTEETQEQIGDRLKRAYDALPREFMGWKRRETTMGSGRLGVMTIRQFYTHLIGTDDPDAIDYAMVEEASLAAAVNGEVFTDPEGYFTAIRDRLKTGYPGRIKYLKIAEAAAHFSQNGQYNYPRLINRRDAMTADHLADQALFDAMHLLHLINDRYAPHDKWLRTSTADLEYGTAVLGVIDRIYTQLKSTDQEACNAVLEGMETLGDFFARLLYANDIISDTDHYLAAHVEELLLKAQYADKSIPELADAVARMEFEAFDKVQNEGGRASCQNDWPTFSVMRKSQYLTWDKTMLLQYIYDFRTAYEKGHNLITEKYGRMMESTAPERYAVIKHNFEPLSDEKKAVLEQIIAVQMSMMETFAAVHPTLADNARSLHTYEDNFINTSYETYLRGEMSTYSDKMLQLYGRYIVSHAAQGSNVPRLIIENTAKLYGFKNLEDFEAFS